MKSNLRTIAQEITTYFKYRGIPTDGLTVILKVSGMQSAAELDYAVNSELTEIARQWTAGPFTPNTRTFEIGGVKFLIVGPADDSA